MTKLVRTAECKGGCAIPEQHKKHNRKPKKLKVYLHHQINLHSLRHLFISMPHYAVSLWLLTSPRCLLCVIVLMGHTQACFHTSSLSPTASLTVFNYTNDVAEWCRKNNMCLSGCKYKQDRFSQAGRTDCQIIFGEKSGVSPLWWYECKWGTHYS